MRWFQQLRMRMQMIFVAVRGWRHLDDELRFHLERQIAENIAAGMRHEEARFAALRSSAIPPCFANRRGPHGVGLASSPCFVICASAAEHFCRTPGFSLIAIFVMALGIGANVALFTVVREVLLKPLPYAEPGRLVMLYESEHATPPGRNTLPVDPRSFFEWQQVPTRVEQMAMVSPLQELQRLG